MTDMIFLSTEIINFHTITGLPRRGYSVEITHSPSLPAAGRGGEPAGKKMSAEALTAFYGNICFYRPLLPT
jgi:hypothetical protein